jgi:hypothetical protein
VSDLLGETHNFLVSFELVVMTTNSQNLRKKIFFFFSKRQGPVDGDYKSMHRRQFCVFFDETFTIRQEFLRRSFPSHFSGTNPFPKNRFSKKPVFRKNRFAETGLFETRLFCMQLKISC